MHYEKSDFLETAGEETLRTIARARALTRDYYLSEYDDTVKRQEILKELLGAVGENVVIDTPFYCNLGKHIFIGDDVRINPNCTFTDDEKIYIGSRVLIAPNVQIYTASHPVDPKERLIFEREENDDMYFRTFARPVTIGDNVWIGGGAIILPGVTIGENSVIGAGSVVNKSIPANCVAAGNPCRIIREI